MQLTRIPGDGESILSLSGELTLLDAAELKTELLQALASSPRVVIDSRGLTDIDLAGLQLLFSDRQSALARGKALSIDPASSAVLTRQIERAGLAESFVSDAGSAPPLPVEGR